MRTYESDEVDAMIARAISQDREQRPARELVGLTDEEIQTIAFEAVKDNWNWLRFARAIEAKLREKNHG